jgi:hypothetical protein
MSTQKPTIDLSTLTPNPRNPRTISVDAFEKLCASIERDPAFLEFRPIVVDSDGVVLGGNMQLAALKHLGRTEIPASWVKVAEGLTDEQRRRFVLVDNAPEGMSGEWDDDILSADWDLPELGELGFEFPELTGDGEPDSATGDGEGSGEGAATCPTCGRAMGGGE